MEELFKEIQLKFNEVIKSSQGNLIPNTDNLFQQWSIAKEKFIKKFNGLIYEYPETVYFELQPEEKDNYFNEFLDYVEHKGYYDLTKFLNENKEGFYSNTVVESYNYFDTNIPKGMKLVKAFKYFIDSDYELNKIQQKASSIIQQDKIGGKICLSVHPLDFLSISETTYNWRSCHALDGDYRAGNLSYMIDNTTFICYLKSENEEYLPDFGTVKWNSKKWRVLLYLSDTECFITAGRQYPFQTNSGLNFVLSTLLPQVGFGEWSSWMNKRISSIEENGISHYFSRQGYIPLGNKLVDYRDIVNNRDGSLQFNDLLISSCYVPVYAYKISNCQYPYFYGENKQEIITPTIPKIRVGGKVSCLCCGKRQIESSNTMMCPNCELEYGTELNDDIICCDECGRRIYRDDSIWVGENLICQDCYNTFCEECYKCGDAYYREDLIYDEETEQYYCKYCFKILMEESEE